MAADVFTESGRTCTLLLRKEERYISWGTFLGNHQLANLLLPVPDGVTCLLNSVSLQQDAKDLYEVPQRPTEVYTFGEIPLVSVNDNVVPQCKRQLLPL